MQPDTHSSNFPDAALDQLLSARPAQASQFFNTNLHARIQAEDHSLNSQIDALFSAHAQQASPHFLRSLHSKLEAEKTKSSRTAVYWLRSAIAVGSIAALFALSFVQKFEVTSRPHAESSAYAFIPSDDELTRIFALAGSLEDAPNLLAAESGFDAIASLME